MAIATVDDLEPYLRTAGAAGTVAGTPDGLLELLLGAACSRIVEACPDRTLEPLPDVAGEPYRLPFRVEHGQRVIRVPDLRTATRAWIRRDGVTPTDADLLGAELDVAGWAFRRRPRELCALWVKLPYSPGAGELTIEGRWGPAGAKVGTADDDLAVRPDVREAALVWAARVFHNRAARFADNTAGPDGVMAGYFRNLPADVKVVLESLEVPGV